MYVKSDNSNLVAISLPEMEGTAEFSENNIAHVTESDGTVLIENHPDVFSEHNTEDN